MPTDDVKAAAEEPRSEEEILAGQLPITIDGKPRTVRVLKIGEARDWKRKLLGAMAGGIGTMALENLADGSNVVGAFGDRVLELVVAYDVDATLGGREYLEMKATDQEVYAGFRRMLAVSFPFVSDLRMAVAELRALGLSDLLAVAAAGRSPDDGSDSERSMPEDSESGGSLLVASTRS